MRSVPYFSFTCLTLYPGLTASNRSCRRISNGCQPRPTASTLSGICSGTVLLLGSGGLVPGGPARDRERTEADGRETATAAGRIPWRPGDETGKSGQPSRRPAAMAAPPPWTRVRAETGSVDQRATGDVDLGRGDRAGLVRHEEGRHPSDVGEGRGAPQ